VSIPPWPLVREGRQEPSAQTLQCLLRTRHHQITVAGIFGAETDSAVALSGPLGNCSLNKERVYGGKMGSSADRPRPTRHEQR
jgi:hypothetical protein